MPRSCSVFISATCEDLKEYRAAARDAALSVRFRPEMMEYFAASGGPPLGECLDRVSQCDLLIVLVAHRFGWVPPNQAGNDRKSITWLECEHALRQGKEILAFTLDKDVAWPVELKESYRSAAAIEDGIATPELIADVQQSVLGLRAFKKWIDTGRVRATFKDPADLRAEVISALHQWCKRHPEFEGVTSLPRDDARPYLKWLCQQTGTIDIRGLGVGSAKAHSFPIRDLYIPLTATGVDVDGSSPASLEHVSPEIRIALLHRRLVFVGDPGSGKTTLLRRCTFDLATSALRELDEGVTRGSAALSKESKIESPDVSVLDWLLAVFRRSAPKEEEKQGDREAPLPLPIFIRIADLSEHIRSLHGRTGPTLATAPTWIVDFLNRRNRDCQNPSIC